MECPACGYSPLFAGGSCRSCNGHLGGKAVHEAEPTAAEVEALVAEGMTALPAWWGRSRPKGDDPPPYTVPVLRDRGKWNGKSMY